ncbi:MAG: tetratricopeptide repeat protein [Alphaproteobacteria bacterium]|nr:tetratricopeptide repeat protein [Alphaproteobacteria bacterium]
MLAHMVRPPRCVAYFALAALLAAGSSAVALAQNAGSAPAGDSPKQTASAGRLDALFDKLQNTRDPTEAQRTEAAIWQIWLEPGDPAAGSLMKLALDAQQRGDLFGAFALFDAIVHLKPDYAEGWNRRATVLYMLGRYDDSRKDAEKTVELEPRHFGALAGLGLIAAAKNDDDAALEAFETALSFNPHMAQVRASVDALRKKRRNGAI